MRYDEPEMMWEVRMGAGFYGRPIGWSSKYYPFRWMAEFRGWVWRTLNMAPVDLPTEVRKVWKVQEFPEPLYVQEKP